MIRRAPIPALAALVVLAACGSHRPEPPALIRLLDCLGDADVATAAGTPADAAAEVERDTRVLLHCRSSSLPANRRASLPGRWGDWLGRSGSAEQPLRIAAIPLEPAANPFLRIDVTTAAPLAAADGLFAVEVAERLDGGVLADESRLAAVLRKRRAHLRPLAPLHSGDGTRHRLEFAPEGGAPWLLIGAFGAPERLGDPRLSVLDLSRRGAWLARAAVPGASPWQLAVEVDSRRQEALVLPAGARARFRLRLPAGEPRFLADFAAFLALPVETVAGSVRVTAGSVSASAEVAAHTGDPEFAPLALDLTAFAGRDVVLELAAGTGSAAALAAFGKPRVEVAREDPRPDVVLVSLDTVRADRLSLYGANRPTSPALDRLGSAAIVFDRAIAAAPWTLPAHASLLSGLYPDRHGAHGARSRVPAAVPWLPEQFARAGYSTAAFTGGGYVLPEFGFARGFDDYAARDPAFPSRALAERAADGGRTAAKAERSARERARLLEHLSAPRRGPRFTFVHSYVAHEYAAAPDDLRALGVAEADVANLAGSTSAADLNLRIQRDPGARERTAAEAEVRYLAGLRAADALVRDVVEALSSGGRLEHTVVVVTSDHGEELFERGGFGHGSSVFEEQVRVPLLIHVPGLAPRRVADVVSQVDVAPTLRALVGLEAGAADGRDLGPLLRGGALLAEPALVRGSEQDRVFRALRGSRYKLVAEESDAGPAAAALFDLQADPAERADLWPTADPRQRGLEPALRERVAGLRARAAATVESAISSGTMQDLRALGYLGGAAEEGR